jgi:hypothetical protein
MSSLERIYKGDAAHNDKIIRNLLDAIVNPNGRLANPAARTLKKLMEKSEFKDAAKAYYNQSKWKDWEKEKLKTIFE